MAKKHTTTIGYVLLKSNTTQWKAEVNVLYKDETMMIVCDCPNTKLPMYFLIAREYSNQVWSKAQNFMNTIDTRGVQLSKLNDQICSDFDKINATFMTPSEAEQWYKNFIAEK